MTTVGIVGAGAVGSACTFAMALRGSAREIVLVNRTHERARGAVADLQYGTVLGPAWRSTRSPTAGRDVARAYLEPNGMVSVIRADRSEPDERRKPTATG